MVFHGFHELAVQALRPAGNTQHGGLARPVNVGIQHANARALGGQRQCQVGSRGAFSHAPLARGHGNDIFNLGKQLHAALHRMGDDLAAEVHRDPLDTRHRHGGSRETFTQRFKQGLGRVAQLHVKGDIATACLDIAHCARADQVCPGVGVFHCGQRSQQFMFGNSHGEFLRRFHFK